MIRRMSIGVLPGFLLAGVLACAQPGVEDPALPAHPFPRWVSELESGQTVEAVRDRFGPPDEIEMNARGERVWRYAFTEIEWPADDPDRPVVSEDGGAGPPAPSAFARIGDGFRAVGLWIDGAFFFPPRQPRPPARRSLPATIHRLEVVFGADGTLRRVHYRPERGIGFVSNGS